MSVFQEEADALGDERAALDETKNRFGDPGSLVEELQSTVPRWDRFRWVLERMDLQPGESMLHLAGKHLLVMFAAYGLATLLLLSLITSGGRHDHLPMILYVMCLSPALPRQPSRFCSSFCPIKSDDRSTGPSNERSVPRALVYGAVSLLIFPAFALLTRWALCGNLAPSMIAVPMACCFSPIAPLLVAMTCRTMAQQRRYREEWASLEIEAD